MKKNYLFFLYLFLVSFQVFSQEEKEEEEEDFSKYEDFGLAGEGTVKRYATPKIFGLTPAKLISIGYDVQGPNTLTTSALSPFPEEKTKIQATHGLRFLVNLPVISYNKLLVNLGFNYWETHYAIKDGQNITNPLARTLDKNGLRTMGLMSTVFRPLNEKRFILAFGSTDLSGNYGFSNFQSLKYLRYSWAVMYGIKAHERKQYGFGITQSYRAGEVNYFPIILYNYTSENRKWGVEMLLPARAHLRRTFNTRNILLFGFELEGQSYRLNNRDNFFPTAQEQPAGYMPHYNSRNLELRRSELRWRFVYERAITDFIWISTQVGYVYNYRFDVDSGNFFRGFFGDQPYVMENKLSNPIYLNLTLSLVSP